MPKLTESQRRVLQLLAEGWYGEPRGKDELGGIFLNGNARETFNEPTISFLIGERLIRIGDVYAPFELTEAGKKAATKPEKT